MSEPAIIAMVIAGLTLDEQEALFHDEEWPCEFRVGYRKAKTPSQKVKVLKGRVEHFIMTGE